MLLMLLLLYSNAAGWLVGSSLRIMSSARRLQKCTSKGIGRLGVVLNNRSFLGRAPKDAISPRFYNITHACIYIYIYIYIHIHICVHIYIYICTYIIPSVVGLWKSCGAPRIPGPSKPRNMRCLAREYDRECFISTLRRKCLQAMIA